MHRVLLVAANASAQMGGEAILPLHWLRELRTLGVDAHLVTHARCRDELSESEFAKAPIAYIEDSSVERAIWAIAKRTSGFPARLANFLLSLVSTMRLGAEVRRLTKELDIELIHQVVPVSPRLASPITHPSVPVVIGPLNGNMTYPDGFAQSHGEGTSKSEGIIRVASEALHVLLPGKPRAARIFSSNVRTTRGLPRSVKPSRVVEFVENGVDLDRWLPLSPMSQGPTRFIFVGRLVRWKAVDILLQAFTGVEDSVTLTICGDGDQRQVLEQLASDLGLSHRVTFLGKIPQTEVVSHVQDSHCLVLPSLYECGGAVVLEAMAMSRAVIATNWGGPADYVTEDTGLLIDPESPKQFSADLTDAMKELSSDPQRMESMGLAGRQRIEEYFAWSKKGKDMLGHYERILARRN